MSSQNPLNPNSEKRSRLTVAELYKRNKDVVKMHKPIETFEEIRRRGLAGPPILVLTCADLRCVPEHFFNMKRGETVVMRGIGGRVEAQLTGILGVDSLFEFKEFVVVHHTDCGILHFQGLRDIIQKRAPGDERVESLDLLETTDLKESVRHDLRFFRDCQYVREELRKNSYGFIYDIKSGELIPVDVAGEGRL